MKKSVIIIVLGVILYSFSLFNGFVWDDEGFIEQRYSSLPPIIQSVKTQVFFRPAISLVYTSLHTLFGIQPFFHHLFQVVFHIATALMIYYLFRRLFKENVAFVLSLLFLVHPSNVEAVCFASAMQEVLFTLTGLGGLYFLVCSKKISVITILGSTVLVSVSFLMKETGIVFFALIFGYLFLFHKKNTTVIQLYGAFSIIVIFAYMFVRFSSGNMYIQDQGIFPIMRASFTTRLINIPMIIFYYLSKFFFPLNLGIAQHWVVYSLGFTSFFLPLIVEIALLISVIIYILKTKNKLFAFFFLWFLIGLLPHIQIIPLNMTVAERWLYFPMIGLLGMGGVIIQSLELKTESLKLKVMFVCLLIIFFVRSFVRTLDWRSGLSLFGRDIRKDSSFDLQNNLGVELFRTAKYKEAMKYFKISTRLAPYWWVNWDNLGVSYERQNNYQKARECYQAAIKSGGYSPAYENYARILVLHGTDKKETETFLKKAIALFPDNKYIQDVQIYYYQQLRKNK